MIIFLYFVVKALLTACASEYHDEKVRRIGAKEKNEERGSLYIQQCLSLKLVLKLKFKA